VVVAHELIIEKWCTHVLARALATIADSVVGADSIISIDDSLTRLGETAQQVEGVVWHKSATVQGVPEELSETLGVWLSLVESLVNLHLRDHVLVQGLNVGNHTARGDNTLLCQLGSTRVVLAQDAVSLRHPGVSSHNDEVFSGDTY
jgi:hypothetical protein